METGVLSRLRENASRNSSSVWRNSSVHVFSMSSREEDDEESLKWAALEKLPTYSRMKKGLLAGSNGAATEVDIGNLDLQQKKNLMDRLIKAPEKDNEKFLLKLKQRIDRVGIELPTIEVRFEHLTVNGEAHVGSRALPSFINVFTGSLEGLLRLLHLAPNRKKKFTILRDVSGIIKPSRMTLLLGPPGSGKTTLLLALAEKLSSDLKVSGRVTYNGHDMNEFVSQRTAAYIGQHDVHLGELTVRETLAYSATFQGVGSRYEMLAELSRREKQAGIKPDPDIDVFMKAMAMQQKESVVTDYILRLLGLDVCADTLVGDQMIRGISGGQKKRVTTGEMIVGPCKALFMDEISTGLDSSTTYQIVNAIKQSVHILKGTAFISLLQPAPETYDLFDDIVLLSDGQIVYQGPREYVLEFFESLGFKCPERKGVADFLQEVTSKKDQHQYWNRRHEPYRFVTVKEFADAFQSFHVGHKLGDELAVPFDKTNSHPAALTKTRYAIGTKAMIKATFSRELLLMRRNSFVYIFKFCQLTFMAFVAMTVFLRTHMHKDTYNDGTVYAGALFFGLSAIMFNGMAEMPMTLNKLPVFYKQRDFLFFPAWAYGLPSWIIKIPTSLIDAAIWVFSTYYVIGFDPNVGRLFKQYLLLVIVNQMASGLFRTIAAVGRNINIATTFGSFALYILFALGGFILSRDDIKKWWLWGYWVSPMMYGQNAIAVNEFLGQSWKHIPAGSTEPVGITILKSRGFFLQAYWFWLGLGAVFGFMLLFNAIFIWALTFLDPYEKPQAMIPEDSENNDQRIEISIQKSEIPSKGWEDQSSTRRSVDGSHNRKRGMVLPFTQHSLTFDEITYSVDMPEAMKAQGVTEDRLILLNGVSGAFRPGVLTALMGVSGAGKTTLMDVLAGRKTGGYIDGNITISGYPKKQETFARISGYCEQNDIHSPHVTVYESLVYSAWLRLPPEINAETRKMFVEEVIELVELNSLRGALVGLPGLNGLSTEQRKRLTIAVELVANPSIIFMDEPTSGLDARAAAIVMRTVRNTVDTGRTVVCTIHQPSIDIFEAFDELFLMKRGGNEIYVGPLGRHSSCLVEYFEGIKGVSKIKDGYNPATWMLEVTSEAQAAALGVDFAELYENSDLYRRNKELIKELGKSAPGSKDLHFPTKYSQPFLTQLLACLWKQHMSYWRNTTYTALRFFVTTLLALMFGTMFWDLGTKRETRQDLFNAMGCMYASVIFLGSKYSSLVQPIVSVERAVFYRERAAGMYSALAYAFAQVLIELPYIVTQASLYCVIAYAMIGFEWTAAKFFWYLYIMCFTLLFYTFTGMMMVALTPSLQTASIIGSLFYSMWNLFSGFLAPRTRIPVWWRWFVWIDPVYWTLYGLVVSQFGDVRDRLENGQEVKQFLEEYFGFKHGFLGAIAGVLVVSPVLFATIFAFSIKIFNFQRR